MNASRKRSKSICRPHRLGLVLWGLCVGFLSRCCRAGDHRRLVRLVPVAHQIAIGVHLGGKTGGVVERAGAHLKVGIPKFVRVAPLEMGSERGKLRFKRRLKVLVRSSIVAGCRFAWSLVGGGSGHEVLRAPLAWK